MLTCEYLKHAACRFPGKAALICGNGRYTYEQLNLAANRVANWLIARFKQSGFRVGILTDDPYEYVNLYFGIQRAGGIAVGLNTQNSSRILLHTLGDCGAAALFANSRFDRLLDEMAARLPSLKHIVCDNYRGGVGKSWSADGVEKASLSRILQAGDTQTPCPSRPVKGSDIAQIVYTSGTTGDPKGVMLRHDNLVANTGSIISYLRLTADDRAMAVLPFFYSYGNSVLLTHIAAGASLVVNQNFVYPNVILEEMRRERVSGLSGVTSTFALLLHRSAVRKYSFPSLRYLTQAGAAMAPKLARSLQDVFPGVDIFVMYGQTEASARLAYLLPRDLFRKPGSVGKPIPGVTLRLLDPAGKSVAPGQVGEIVATGENIMAGYWGCVEETAKVLTRDGLRTGDLGWMDDEGFLYIVGRKRDMIKSGAHRIAPKEIEETIQELGAVHEVAVIGVEDEILGEVLKAYVALRAGFVCQEREIIRHCRKYLPAFKVPRFVDFVPELPKTSTGKICKEKLKFRLSRISPTIREGTNEPAICPPENLQSMYSSRNLPRH